jgi:predicted DNA-binding transcriptional regulator AlpA
MKRVRVDPNDELQLIRKRSLAKLLSVNSFTIDNWRKRGLMPPCVKLTEGTVAWRRCDIEHWLQTKLEAAE